MAQLIALGEAHLRRVLIVNADYGNRTQMHLSLTKDAPLARQTRLEDRVKFTAQVGGTHHSYLEIWFSEGMASRPD
jgi:hypothetical protein